MSPPLEFGVGVADVIQILPSGRTLVLDRAPYALMVAPIAPDVVQAPPSGVDLLVLPVAGPPGPPGPPGLPGGAGGGYYVHVQTAPSASWVIDHNLGQRVHVSVFDTITAPFRLVYADVEHGSLNQATVTFPYPVVGTAVLS